MKIFSGVLHIARFRAEGMQAFGATPRALLNSLAPLLAFPVVGGLLDMLHGQFISALSDLLATLVALLTPLVVTEAFARRWGREALWLRFAVASNWCQWALPVVLMAMLLCLWVLANLGLPVGPGIVSVGIVGLIVYGVSLHWFLARVGLDLTRGRAMIVVLAADLLTGLLVLMPRLLAASS